MDENQRRGQIRILVADDQVEARGVIQSLLSSLGFINVYQASTGPDAIDIAIKREAQLIICDWNMPGASGLDVLMTLRKHPKHRNTAFLMLTSEGSKENVRQAFKAGVTSYLIKPVTAKALIAELDKLTAGIIVDEN